MSNTKFLKIKLINADEYIFELEEPGNIGDQICLKNLNEIDFSSWQKEVANLENPEVKKIVETEILKKKQEIEEEKNKEIQNLTLAKQQLEDSKKSLEESIDLKIKDAQNEIEKQKNDEIQQLKDEKKNLENQLDNLNKSTNSKIQIAKNEIEKQKADEIQKLKNDKRDLENKINNLNDTLDLQIKNEKANVEKQKDQEIKNLTLAKQQLENNKKFLEESINLKIKDAQNEIEKQKDQEIQQWKNKNEKLVEEIEGLKRQKNLLSTKAMGEDLEQWCLQQYQLTMGNIADDCLFEKANTIYDEKGNISKTGTKADFIFSVYDRPVSQSNKILIGSVTLEMKTQSETGNKKNDDFLTKLEKDMHNNKSDYAILVSELEPDVPIVIDVRPQYKNIFIVRPNSMIALLTILRKIILKQKNVILQKIQFEDATVILDKWNAFKDNLLNLSIQKIQNNLEEIQKSVDSARQSLQKIEDAKNTILNAHLNTVINKITNFKIEKEIVNKIENENKNKLRGSDQAIYESEEVVVKDHLKTNN